MARFSGRPLLVTASALALTLTGCSPVNPDGSPSGNVSESVAIATPTPSHISASETPAPISLLTPGVARQAVNELSDYSARYPVIKLDLTAEAARMTVLVDQRPVEYSWINGQISQTRTSMEYFGQASFNPADFAFDGLEEIFSIAASISGSDHAQELQMVEYNESQILMSVTTQPETRPVFFRPDGSLISTLNFAQVPDLTEGINDVCVEPSEVTEIAYSPKIGLWADYPHQNSTTVTRRTRPADLPVWTAPRKGTDTSHTFSCRLVQARVIAGLARFVDGVDPNADNPDFSFRIAYSADYEKPVITYNANGETVVADLAGRRLNR